MHAAGGSSPKRVFECGGERAMRKAIVVALMMYILVSRGGTVSGPFNSSVDCESYRINQGSFAYCLPLWQQ